MDGDNDGDDNAGVEEFFNFHPDNNNMHSNDPGPKRSATRKKDSQQESKQVNKQVNHENDAESQGHSTAQEGNALQIDSLFSRIFGIERVHVLNKNDRLQDVIEKISIIPENKLVYVEENPIVGANGQVLPGNADSDDEEGAKNGYKISNILTLGYLLTYLCPSQQEDR